MVRAIHHVASHLEGTLPETVWGEGKIHSIINTSASSELILFDLFLGSIVFQHVLVVFPSHTLLKTLVCMMERLYKIRQGPENEALLPFLDHMRELLKQMDVKLFISYRSEPHGAIHRAALI